MEKKIRMLDLGFAINIPDHISKSFVIFNWVKIPEFFAADPVPGCGSLLVLDPGWKNSFIPYQQHCFFYYKYGSIRIPCVITNSYRYPRGFRPWSFEISSVFETLVPLFYKFQCYAFRNDLIRISTFVDWMTVEVHRRLRPM
jgi:hypothetical protein